MVEKCTTFADNLNDSYQRETKANRKSQIKQYHKE